MATEGGLLEEPRDKFVVIDDKYVFLLEGALPPPLARGKGRLHVSRPGVVVIFLVLLLFVRHFQLKVLPSAMSSTSLLHSLPSTEPRRSSAPRQPHTHSQTRNIFPRLFALFHNERYFTRLSFP